MKPIVVFVILVSIQISWLWANEGRLATVREMLDVSAFPENQESRHLFSDLIMAPAYPDTEPPFRIFRQRTDGRLVQFELRKGIREWYLIFRSQRGEEPWEKYPLWGRGTWIIKKDLFSDKFIQAKVFLQDGEESFIRIFPHGSHRSRLDIHLFGRQLGDDVILPAPFEKLILKSFAYIVSLTDNAFDWSLIFPNPRQIGYRRIETFVRTMKSFEERIIEIDDAGIDGEGQNVFIESGNALPSGLVPSGLVGLNCSGYVKWIVDGVHSAWEGTPGRGYLDMKPLIKPTERLTWNAWSESRFAVNPEIRSQSDSMRDPYFGLDWNRNLAYLAESARIKRNLTAEEQRALDSGKLYSIPYTQDVGYRLEDLSSVLYQLAILHPGSIYLAAINSRFVSEESDSQTLPLHQYWHVLALAPWFEDGKGGEIGSLRVAILDTGDVSETLLRKPGMRYTPPFLSKIIALATKYAKLGEDEEGNSLVPEIMVHLVRMEFPENFQPPPLPYVN